MKQTFYALLLTLFCLNICCTPQHHIRRGDFSKAFDAYVIKYQHHKKGRVSKQEIRRIEAAFAVAQSRDSTELAHRVAQPSKEQWLHINALHRSLQMREQKAGTLQNLKSRRGYTPHFRKAGNIDSLQHDSRGRAADYLYQKAQNLLAEAAATGKHKPAREAYATVKDLKTNYFHYWKDANILLDSAYNAGMLSLCIDPQLTGMDDEKDFWKIVRFKSGLAKNEWLEVSTDSVSRQQTDYHARCRLVALSIGPDNSRSFPRIETIQVHDGFDTVADSSGKVISCTPRYRYDTKTITTSIAERSAHGAVLVELFDERNGQMLSSVTLNVSTNYLDSSEVFFVTAPTHLGMVWRLAEDAQVVMFDHFVRFLSDW